MPALTECIQAIEPSIRPKLLAILLPIELRALDDGNVSASVDDYVARFPDQESLIRTIFFEFRDQPTLPPSGNTPRESVDANSHQTVDHASGVSSTAAGSSTPAKGQRFGDFEIMEEIARGGMGIVFRARETKLDRDCALKMILAGHLASDLEVQRFYAEAQAAANLEHPGIVPIYEIGQIDGQHFFSMKFIDRGSLADQVAELRDHPRRSVELIEAVARAVHFAHQRGDFASRPEACQHPDRLRWNSPRFRFGTRQEHESR